VPAEGEAGFALAATLVRCQSGEPCYSAVFPDIFLHRSTQSYHHASGLSKENSRPRPKSATQHKTSLG
jgi:hypothetical protein